MSLSQFAAAELAKRFQTPGWRGHENDFLSGMLRYLNKWRSQMVANTLVARDGAVVQTGPFAGMNYVASPTEGGLAPRLLGTYEAELHPFIGEILAAKPETIIDIGCAEGYYAVGFALLAPFATIHAFDISEAARTACTGLAALNGVGERIQVRGELTTAGLQALCDHGAFVFCDIEGGEAALLDPEKAPALAHCSLIVETHPGAAPGVTELLKSRFEPTHLISEAREMAKNVPAGHWLEEFNMQDRLMATWEWRAVPTPWLVMTPKPAV